MTFGETLKTIMRISGIKGSQFADVLGYDSSYISRWLTGEKLPSKRNNNKLFGQIADYVVKVSSEEEILAIMDEFNVSGSIDAPGNYAKSVEDILSNSYLKQIGLLSRKRDTGILNYNCAAYPSPSPELYCSILIDGVQRALAADNSQTIYICSSRTIACYNNPSVEPFAVLRDLVDNKHQICMRQIVSYQDLLDNPEACCRGLIHAMEVVDGLDYQLYLCEEPLFVNTNLTTIQDKAYIREVSDYDFSQPYLLVSNEDWLISKAMIPFEQYVHAHDPLMKIIKTQELKSTKHFLNFMMQSEYWYILNIMHPIYCTPDQVRAIIPERDTSDGKTHQWENSFDVKLYQNSNKTVVVFKSAYLDYLYYGRMVVGGYIEYLSIDKRITHLKGLLQAFENPNFSLCILEDENPLLCYEECGAALYVSNRTAHSTIYDTRNYSFPISEPRIVDAFKTMIENISQLPDRYVLKGQDVIDYIVNGIRWLETNQK